MTQPMITSSTSSGSRSVRWIRASSVSAARHFAANAALESGARAATLELKYSTMRATQAGDVLSVRGEVVRLARQVAYLETAISAADGEPVSKGTGTFFVRRKADRPPKEAAS